MFKISNPDAVIANWRQAIEDWRTGDPSLMDMLLRGSSDLPDFARAFLADVLAGNIKRPKGAPRKPRYRPIAEDARETLIRMDYARFYEVLAALAALERKRGEKTPKEKAFEAVAKKWRFKVKPGAVSHIVHKRRGR